MINTGQNYFFSLDYNNGKITELSIPDTIDLLPSFLKLNDYYFITIGGAGIDSSGVSLYEVNANKWINVGKLSSPRSGAYALMSNEDNTVYICGGSNFEGDNSLNIEYFTLSYSYNNGNEGNYNNYGNDFSENTENTYSNNLINTNLNYTVNTKVSPLKQIKFKNDYLLRKSNPIVLPLLDDNSYLICGGSNIFGATNTCTVFNTDNENIFLSSMTLPEEYTTCNSDFYAYKNSIYFMTSGKDVYVLSLLDNSFEVIRADEFIEI